MTEASALNLPPLEPGWWRCDHSRSGSLLDALERADAHAAECGREWQGIAYTTAGARALRTVSPGALRATDGQQVPLESIYELRLWRTGADRDARSAPGEIRVLAQELRWLNGSGTAELVVRASDKAPADDAAAPREDGWEDCWYRPNSYLQHGATAPFDASDEMTSMEVFIEDDSGNIVFVDELMTGAWG